MSATESLSPASADRPVTIVTQTRVRPEHADAFANWQSGASKGSRLFPASSNRP
jgi:antibiotic biosynthesis monooxygenase (ABM) superfamily enzyme